MIEIKVPTCFFVFASVLFIGGFAKTSIAQETLPIVVWVTMDGTDDSQNNLYHAIRAQLSGTPVILKQARASSAKLSGPAQQNTLTKISTQYQASLIFWAEDNETCRTFYHLPYSPDARIIERELHIQSQLPASRQEFIAIAAAGMVERLLVTKKITPPEKVAAPAPPSPKPPQQKPVPTIGEVHVSYGGILFSKDAFQHGVGIGIGFELVKHLIVGFAFTPFFPAELQNDLLRLQISSRIFELSAAAQFTKRKADIRLGAAWQLDIRSFETTLQSDELQQKNNGRKGVHSIAPFVLMGYQITRRFSLFFKMALPIALNETNYNSTIDEIVYPVQQPYAVKPFLGAGVTFKF